MSDELERKVEERAKQALEEEKSLRLVNDRAGGQPLQLRPSTEFIARHTHPLKTDEQIKGEHRERILREEQAQRDDRNTAMSERDARDHQNAHEQAPTNETPRPSLTDRIREMAKGISGSSDDQRGIGNNIGRKNDKDDPGIER